MDAQQAELLRTIDPVVLGGRLRAARLAAGLTQGQMAGGDVTVSYVSRIESGQRRPDARVLSSLLAKISASLEDVLTDLSTPQSEELRLKLTFAELALESGDGLEACRLVEEIFEQHDDDMPREHLAHAKFTQARAFEATGRLDEAIVALQVIVTGGASSPYWLCSGIALCRCFRETGDFPRSIRVGEAVLQRLSELRLDGSDEAIQLTVTLAGAYFLQGDTGHAVRLCMVSLERADELGSPSARAAAYWNASVFEADRGSVASAIPLAERALALLGEGRDLRNIARCRSQLAAMQLQLDPPQHSEAFENLTRAGHEMRASSASAVDIRRNDLSLARALLHSGECERAHSLAAEIHEATDGVVPLLSADALAVKGQAAAAMGDLEEAKVAYHAAVLVLSGVGGDRWAAQLWMELGGLLEEVDDHDAARDAYRRAAASVGLRVSRSVGARV